MAPVNLPATVFPQQRAYFGDLAVQQQTQIDAALVSITYLRSLAAAQAAQAAAAQAAAAHAAASAAQAAAAAFAGAQHAAIPAATPTPTAPAASTGAAPAGGAWAELRQCESGGNYAENTGNGYYGAYQFALATWNGLGFSGLPSQASPATQDAAAAELQARSGWGQWPACSRKLGL